MSKRYGWMASVALSLTSTLLALVILGVVAELGVRYRERHRSTVPGTAPLLYYRQSRLRHALVRNFDYFGWIHINEQGFRSRAATGAKQPDVLRIMAVGSSTTFDPQVTSDSATWPARLEVWLTRLSPGRRFEVINAGVPGYYVIDNVIRLETELYKYQPDLMILYEGHNDLFGALQRGSGAAEAGSDRPDEVPVVTPWGRWLGAHSLLYAKVRGRLRVIGFRSRGEATRRSRTAESVDTLTDDRSEDFARHLNTFFAVARGFGLQVVVPELVHVSGVGAASEPDSVVRLGWRRAVPAATPENVLRGYILYNQALRRVAEQNGVPWIATASFDVAGPQWYAEGDPIHFNEGGSERFAEQMARALLAAGVLR